MRYREGLDPVLKVRSRMKGLGYSSHTPVVALCCCACRCCQLQRNKKKGMRPSEAVPTYLKVLCCITGSKPRLCILVCRGMHYVQLISTNFGRQLMQQRDRAGRDV